MYTENNYNLTMSHIIEYITREMERFVMQLNKINQVFFVREEKKIFLNGRSLGDNKLIFLFFFSSCKFNLIYFHFFIYAD